MEETLGQENESLPGKTDVNGTEKSVTEKCSNDTVATVAQPLNHHQIDQVLHIQQERERKRQTHQLYEARRRQTIEERRRRLALMPELRDGVYIQVKYGDGSARKRRFYLKHSIQILFDFAGSDDMATDVFHIQTAISSTATPSTATGTLYEHGITGPSTVYALWLGPEEVEERLTQNALVAVPTSPSPVHSSGVHQKETTAGTELNTAPSASQENITHNHKELHAEAVEDSIVALSWPWFIPIEEAAVARPSLSPSHSTVPSVTSLPNPRPHTKRGLAHHSLLLERERAELEANRMQLERERAELERERVELEQERAGLAMDRVEFAQDRERGKAELERERVELQRDRTHVEHSRRVLFLFHTLLQKL